jgi:hypothetical protein
MWSVSPARRLCRVSAAARGLLILQMPRPVILERYTGLILRAGNDFKSTTLLAIKSRIPKDGTVSAFPGVTAVLVP